MLELFDPTVNIHWSSWFKIIYVDCVQHSLPPSSSVPDSAWTSNSARSCLSEDVCSLPALTDSAPSGTRGALGFPVATGCYSWRLPLCMRTARCFQDTPAGRLMVSQMLRSRSAAALVLLSRWTVTLNHSSCSKSRLVTGGHYELSLPSMP